jgi:hypothetical protein
MSPSLRSNPSAEKKKGMEGWATECFRPSSSYPSSSPSVFPLENAVWIEAKDAADVVRKSSKYIENNRSQDSHC